MSIPLKEKLELLDQRMRNSSKSPQKFQIQENNNKKHQENVNPNIFNKKLMELDFENDFLKENNVNLLFFVEEQNICKNSLNQQNNNSEAKNSDSNQKNSNTNEKNSNFNEQLQIQKEQDEDEPELLKKQKMNENQLKTQPIKCQEKIQTNIKKTQKVSLKINNFKFGKVTDYLSLETKSKSLKVDSNNSENLITQLQNQLKQKTQELAQRDKQIEDLQKELQRKNTNQFNDSLESKARNLLQQYSLENAQLKRSLQKIQLNQQKLRLGEYLIDGVQFKEKWVDGIDIQDLNKELNELNNQINFYSDCVQKIKNSKPKKFLNLKSQILENNANQLEINNLFQPEFLDDSILNSKPQDTLKSLQFQLCILQKKKQQVTQNLESKKREIKELIKKYQLQYLEENSKYGRFEKWPVLGERYQLLGLLGKGGFSEVYKALDLNQYQYVAIKIHNIDNNWSNQTKQNYVKHAIREHQIQKELIHPNIVQLYDYIQLDKLSFASVLQYCDGMDLSQYLKMHGNLQEQDAKHIIKCILDVLEYLNSFQNKVIHYDLKPQNIIFHKGQMKVTDFGLSKIIMDNSTRLELTSQGVGTYWYLPPECFMCLNDDDKQQFDDDEEKKSNQVVKISNKVDIWSLGVIFFELLYGEKPFGNKMSQQQILQENTILLNARKVIFPEKPLVSKECKSFICGCLKYEQDERFDINQALQHVYFKQK